MSRGSTTETSEPMQITETTISRAYARILLRTLDGPGNEITPLSVSISGFHSDGSISEDPLVRKRLDALLHRKGRHDVNDVAFTIFPQRLWEMAQGDRKSLFKFYEMAFPAYKAMNRRLNGRGLYFERLMMYGRGPCNGNQLEFILSQYRRGVRRSMLQAAIFDPERDHTPSAQLGFPCLQQVHFEPTSAGLVTNAFYATQQVFDKAYGNYLGLAQLGAFVAHELEMPLARLNVNVGVAKLERINKTDPTLDPLVSACRAVLGPQSARIGQSSGTAAEVRN